MGIRINPEEVWHLNYEIALLNNKQYDYSGIFMSLQMCTSTNCAANQMQFKRLLLLYVFVIVDEIHFYYFLFYAIIFRRS